MTNFIECNTLNIFIQFSETALFLVEISQPAPRNPTKCCIIAHRSTAFTGRNGIMETGSPHYQQTFQHKRGAINDVMLTTDWFSHFSVLFFPARTSVRRSGILLRFCPAPTQTRRRPLCVLQVRKTPGAERSRGRCMAFAGRQCVGHRPVRRQ